MALTTVRAAPALVVLTILLGAGPAALDAAASHRSLSFLSSFSIVIFLATLGFYGTQRVWLLKAGAGQELQLAAAPRFWSTT